MRTVPVLVPSVLIGDGQVRVPTIGDTVQYYLRFTEISRESNDPLASTFPVRAEPVGDSSPRRGTHFDGTPHDRAPYFPTRLHADGWGALWAAPRNVAGQLDVHGSLFAEFGALALTDMVVQGRIVRLRTVWSVIDTSDPHQQNWREIPDRRIITDVKEISIRSGKHPESPQPKMTHPSTSSGGWEPYTPRNESKTEYSGVLVDLSVNDLA